jgi:hypothetical protein
MSDRNLIVGAYASAPKFNKGPAKAIDAAIDKALKGFKESMAQQKQYTDAIDSTIRTKLERLEGIDPEKLDKSMEGPITPQLQMLKVDYANLLRESAKTELYPAGSEAHIEIMSKINAKKRAITNMSSELDRLFTEKKEFKDEFIYISDYWKTTNPEMYAALQKVLVDHEYIPGWDDKGMGNYTVEIDDPNSPGKTKTVTITSDDFDWGVEETGYTTELTLEAKNVLTPASIRNGQMGGAYDQRVIDARNRFENYFKKQNKDGTLEESLASLAFDGINLEDDKGHTNSIFMEEDLKKLQLLVQNEDWEGAKDLAVQLAVDRLTDIQNTANTQYEEELGKLSENDNELTTAQKTANRQWELALGLGKSKKKIKARAVSTNMYGKYVPQIEAWVIVDKDDVHVPVYVTNGEPEKYTLEGVLRELGYTDQHLKK